jgi:hypothetical protein
VACQKLLDPEAEGLRAFLVTAGLNFLLLGADFKLSGIGMQFESPTKCLIT